MEEKQVW